MRWTFPENYLEDEEGLLQDLQSIGGHLLKSHPPGSRKLVHVVARTSAIPKFRNHWITEYLDVEPQGPTDPTTALVTQVEAQPDLNLGREYLCTWACGLNFKGTPHWRHRKRTHELYTCPNRRFITYEEHMTWRLSARAQKAILKTDTTQYEGPEFSVPIATLTPYGT